VAGSSKDQAKAWQKVGREFETLGSHLRESFDEVSTGAAAERRALEESARQLFRMIEKGFGVGAPLVNDPRLKRDVTSIGAALRDALDVTLSVAKGTRTATKKTTKSAPRTATKKTTKTATKAATKKTTKTATKAATKRATKTEG